jgi:hypothetical protein
LIEKNLFSVPKRCQDLLNLGLDLTGYFMIDPDGPLFGDPPLEVLCDADTGKIYIYQKTQLQYSYFLGIYNFINRSYSD